jgi:hypothetical protein
LNSKCFNPSNLGTWVAQQFVSRVAMESILRNNGGPQP